MQSWLHCCVLSTVGFYAAIQQEDDKKDSKEKEEKKEEETKTEETAAAAAASAEETNGVKKKKSVKWKKDSDLVEIRYFEMDANERGMEEIMWSVRDTCVNLLYRFCGGGEMAVLTMLIYV